MAKNNVDTAAAKPSEKYLLGEKMVVEFLGKPYELGVRITWTKKYINSRILTFLNIEKQHLLRNLKRVYLRAYAI